MASKYLYYNVSDALHIKKLEKLLPENGMSTKQAEGVECFLECLKNGTVPLTGELPVRFFCIQGDAGTGKTQAIVSMCSRIPCPVVTSSTNPAATNVAERCKLSFPYKSCVQSQLSTTTAWNALRWNIDTEKIGLASEKEIKRIYEECVKRKSAPTEEQDKEIFIQLNKLLLPKLRMKFQKECDNPKQKKIYTAWEHARLRTPLPLCKDKMVKDLYEMFTSLPSEEITQDDFNTALAYRCITAFTETLPRPLLTNFFIVEEAARLPAYFYRILAWYHYMVRFTIKPPGYRNTMLTICLVGSPLQSKLIGFPDCSVMDEAILSAEKGNTHVSIYTVNRRTRGDSLKAKALETVVQVLENDCPLEEEHCRLLDPFVVPETKFMDPEFASSAIRLTHYHRKVMEFIDVANSNEKHVLTFFEHLLVSEGVKAKYTTQGCKNSLISEDVKRKKTSHSFVTFLSNSGAACLPYRNNRSKGMKNEGAEEIFPDNPLHTGKDDNKITYRLFSIKRTLGKNTPITLQHTTRLTPMQFTGTFFSFHHSPPLSNSVAEQLWSLRIGLSFAKKFLGCLSSWGDGEDMKNIIEETWKMSQKWALDLMACTKDDIEERAVLSACVTEAQDNLWNNVSEYDKAGFIYWRITVFPYIKEKERCFFPDVFVRGHRFNSTVTLQAVVESSHNSMISYETKWKHIPHQGIYKNSVCSDILRGIADEFSRQKINLYDLVLLSDTGITFHTVNTLVTGKWSSVFPATLFEWESVRNKTTCSTDNSDIEPEAKKAKLTSKETHETSVSNTQDNVNEEKDETLYEEDDAAAVDEDGDEPCPEEGTSIIHMLHTAYDSRIRTIDSVQGDTITCKTFVDVESITNMGQLTVALTRNTNADDLMLTSSDIKKIAPRNPITKYVRLSSRDTVDCYYVK